MLKIKIGLTLVCLVFSFKFLHAQKLELNGNWKYTFKDEPVYPAAIVNDTGWKEKNGSNLLFKANELNQNSHITWLRKTITILSTWKKELAQTGALALYLGRIYQTDEVYFNGDLIGKTNSSDIQRAYVINPTTIKWDKPNSIAIRIVHWGDICGLQNPYPPYLSAAMPVNIFTLSSSSKGITEKQQAKNKKAIFRLVVNNASPKAVLAMVTASFYDLYKKKISAFHKTVKLKFGSNQVDYPFTTPLAFIKIDYTLTVPTYKYNAHWNAEYGYIDVSYHPAEVLVADKVEPKFTSANLNQQVITGWLGNRLKDNEENRLYNVDEAALLAGYINRPGSHPWIGEHVGKFLDAAANTYRNTGSLLLKTKMDRMAQQLIAGQLNDG